MHPVSTPLVACGSHAGTVSARELEQGEVRVCAPHKLGAPPVFSFCLNSAVTAISISKSGNEVIAGGVGCVKICPLDAGGSRRRAQDRGLSILDVSGTVVRLVRAQVGNFLLCVTVDGLQAFDARTPAMHPVVEYRHATRVADARILTGSGDRSVCVADGDGEVHIFDMREHALCGVVDCCASHVEAVPLSSLAATGQGLVAGRFDGFLVELVSSGRNSSGDDTLSVLSSWASAPNAYVTAVSSEAGAVASCASDGTCRVWGPPERCTRDGDGGLLERPELQVMNVETWANDVCLSSDAANLITASADHLVRLWDVETGACLGTITEFERGASCVALYDPLEDV